MESAEPIFRFGEFELDPALRELRRAGQPIEVQPQPLRLLLYLVRHRQRVVSKDELFTELWPDVFVSEHALTSALRDVRRALGDEGAAQRLIATRRRQGYRFVAAVEELERSAPEDASAASRTASTPFVGRRALLSDLTAALEDATRGRGRILVLAGEPGIGKTRSCEEFARLAVQRGAAVYTAWCYEHEGAPPYWPWIRLLDAVLDAPGSEPLREGLARSAADLAQLLPTLRANDARPADAPQAPEAARFRMFCAVSALLQRAGRARPQVLIIDDLHGADASSLRLLEFLAHEIRDARILLLATYRDADVADGHPLLETLAELARHDLYARLELGGLAEAEVRELASALGGCEISATLLERICAQSGGNPFYVREIAKLLAGGDGEGRLELPRGLREAISSRLAQLPPAARAALGAASIIGRDFRLETLARATGIPAAELRNDLETARAAGVLCDSPEDGYRFSHGVIGETIYAEQSAERRARLHRRVGEALEDRNGSDVERLAHHFGEGVPSGGADKALAYALRAAGRAMTQLAFDEARDHYQRALALKQSADALGHCDLLLSLGEAQMRAGQRARGRESFQGAADIARRLHDPSRLARAAHGFAGRAAVLGTDESSIRLLEEALAALESADTPLYITTVVRLSRHRVSAGPIERAQALLGEAMHRTRRSGDAATTAEVLGARLWLMWGDAHPNERLPLAAECIRLADQVGDDDTASHAQFDRIRAYLELGDLAACDAEFDAASQRVEVRGLASSEHENFVVGYGAMRALLEGRLEDAERLNGEALARARRAEYGPGMLSFAARLGAIRWEQGRVREFEQLAREQLQLNPEMAGWRSSLVLLLAEWGEVAQARAELDRIAKRGFARLRDDPEWLVAASLLSEACIRLGAEEYAEALYELLRPRAGLNVVMGSAQVFFGAAEHYLGQLAGLLGRFEPAQRHFEAAADMHRRLGARPWLERTLRESARVRGGHAQPPAAGSSPRSSHA